MKFKTSIFIGALFLVLLGINGLGAATETTRYARNYTLEHFDGYTLLKVSCLWNGSGDLAYTYALIPKGAEIPNHLPEDAQIIRTPSERTALMATVYLGHLEALGLEDKVIGLAQAQFANSKLIQERLKTGEVKQLSAGATLDVENLLVLQPDLVLTSATGHAQYDHHQQLMRARQPVVITSAYMETHPLGRAEWIKVIGALYQEEEKAAAVFEEIAARYEALAAMAHNAENKPTILCNAPYSGSWYIPGGRSYSAQAIADAGGAYLWADDDSVGGIPMDFETVFLRAAKADIWINPSFYKSRSELIGGNERFMAFDALRAGEVYNNNRRLNEHGGNDIWERGSQHPEEVLADLIKIFHPELLPNHEFVFYQKLP